MSNEPPTANRTPNTAAATPDDPDASTTTATTSGSPDDVPSGWARLVSGLATVVGALSLVGGLTWLLLNLQGPEPALDVAVGAVLAAGGLVLLMPHRFRLPTAATWLVAGGSAVAGTAAGLAAGSAAVCCMFAYVAGRGFPFRWLRRGAVADDPEVARRLAEASRWDVDVVALAADLLVWAYGGLVIVALVVLVRRAVRGRTG